MEKNKPDTKTLQQKPDFTKLGNDFINEYCQDYLPKPRNAYSFGCDKIWNDYVVPLQSQLSSKDKEMEGLNEIHHLQSLELEELIREKESQLLLKDAEIEHLLDCQGTQKVAYEKATDQVQELVEALKCAESYLKKGGFGRVDCLNKVSSALQKHTQSPEIK